MSRTFDQRGFRRQAVIVLLVGLALLATIHATSADTITVNLTDSGNWTIPEGVNTISVIVVGGGGQAGEHGGSSCALGGGGGAGGLVFIENYSTTGFGGVIEYEVGSGGTDQNPTGIEQGANGANTTFGPLVAVGGGGGGRGSSLRDGKDGGSGGGAAHWCGNYGAGGSSIQPTTNDNITNSGFGNDGASTSGSVSAAGGGGASGPATDKNGGSGKTIWGIEYARGGGANATGESARANRGDGGRAELGSVEDATGESGSDGIIVIRYTLPPSFSNETVTTNISGNQTIFKVTFSSGANLSNYTFSTNLSGGWVNDTPVSISGETYQANVTKHLNVSPGTVVGYRWYVTDQIGQENDTGILNFTVGGSTPVVNSVTLQNETSIILGYANITDADEQNLTVEYRWYINSALYDSGSQQINTGGRYNFDNLTNSNYSNGDLIIFSTRATDSGSYSDWTNSTQFLANDTQTPVIENVTQPGTVVQNTAGTFTADATDNVEVANVYVSWTDPNSISVGNLSMSLDSGNTYSRSYTFTTVGNYTDVTFTVVDGNGFTDTISGVPFTVTAASGGGGGGGGGGGTTIQVPNELSGTLTAQPVEVYIGPFNDGGELIITNDGGTASTFTVRITDTDLNERISFAGQESASFDIEGQGSLDGNKKFVSYTVDDEDLPEGNYTVTFVLSDEIGREIDRVVVPVYVSSNALTGFITSLGTPVFGSVTGGAILLLVAFATIAGVLIFRTPKATAKRRIS